MRLRVGSLPTLMVCAAGLAGFLSPTIPLPASAAERATEMERELARLHAGRPGVDRRVLPIGRGDTLMDILMDASVSRNDADSAIAALSEVYDPRKLRVGQQVTVLFEPRRGGPRRFVGLEFEADVVRTVNVARTGDADFESKQVMKKVTKRQVAAAAVIRSSLFEAGSDAGVPVSVMMNLIRAYSYDVDFQRDLQPGDRFEVLFERSVTSDGEIAEDGDVLYAALVLSGKEMPIYRHKTKDGRIDYYNRQGESIQRALLRTPIDGAKITSGFGMRHHPILGYSKMHQGMDFGAPTGTPVYAAGRGTIDEAGTKGAYGNYVRLRHNTEISTAYAHLSRFAKGMQRGAKVDQGDIIGYVGSTGRSTGPHLHYEVLKGGRQVNPKAIDLPTGEKLAGREFQAFEQTVRSLDRAFETAKSGMQLARTTGPAADEKGCTKTTAC